jgi:hypothetical protein
MSNATTIGKTRLIFVDHTIILTIFRADYECNKYGKIGCGVQALGSVAAPSGQAS